MDLSTFQERLEQAGFTVHDVQYTGLVYIGYVIWGRDVDVVPAITMVRQIPGCYIHEWEIEIEGVGDCLCIIYPAHLVLQ